MPACIYRHGVPTMVDHTPTSAVAAGDVVIVNDTPRIAHLDIPANVLGALGAVGGVYQGVGDGAIAVDKTVFWDAVAKKVTLTAGTSKKLGVTVAPACSADGQPCWFRHDPAA